MDGWMNEWMDECMEDECRNRLWRRGGEEIDTGGREGETVGWDDFWRWRLNERFNGREEAVIRYTCD